MHKRQRTLDTQSGAPGQDETTVNQVIDEDGFMADRDDDGNGHDDDGQPKKRWGRRKLMMEFIQDKSRRGKTFSRMKGSILRKGYELSTLTGAQVLIMAVSESGLVYSFTTKHFLPLLTTQSSKDYIRACLNAPLPSPVNPSLVCSFPNTEVGWLSISGGPFESSSKDDDPKDNNDFSHDGRTSLDDKRSRSSTAHAEPGGSGGLSSNTRGTASPHSAIPSGGSPPQHPGSSSQIVLGSPTSSLSSRTTLK